MTVQDDARERELCRLFNLRWNREHKRDGTDAHFSVEVGGDSIEIPVEVKSTTGTSVSTARDVGMPHIKKWRSQFWVIGYYTKSSSPDLKDSLCLTPNDIEGWVASIEKKILPDFMIASCAARRIEMSDLISICGDKEHYTIGDAKLLHKKQWTAKQYKDAPDIEIEVQIKKRKVIKRAISKDKMLALLKLRSEYISGRGATLNNPHISKTFLNQFKGTDRMIPADTEDCGARLRRIAIDYLMANPDHTFKIIKA